MGGSGYLAYNVIEALADAGCELDIYVPVPSRGVSDEVRREYKRKKYEEQYSGKVRIHRFPMFRERKSVAARAFRYFCCGFAHLFIGLFARNVDLMYLASTPPTNGLVAAVIKKIRKFPYVYNLQDIFPDSLVNTNLTSKGSLVWKIGRWIENITYRNADKIIVLSDGFKQNLLVKGVAEDKIVVVHNWIDENEVLPLERKDNQLFDKLSLERGKFYLTHCGNMGYTQNLDLVLGVAKRLEEYKDIQFVFFGDGAEKKRLQRKASDEGINNVVFFPFQDYANISEVFGLGDVGLVVSKPNIGDSSVPSKTWNIMAAERAVLASFDAESELSQIIQSAKCGISVQADDQDKFVEAILKMYSHKKDLQQMGANGRKFVLQNLTRKQGTASYVNVITAFAKDLAV
jgi:glycosyltransferase involved in cell wall biosynthesis